MPKHLENIRVDSLELQRVANLMNDAGLQMGMRGDEGPYRADAGETAIIARQLEYIRQKTTDKVYAESKALRLIPLAKDIPDGARTFVVQQWDMAGYAKLISNYADDLPQVKVSAQERSQMVHDVGNAYSYSIGDLKASAFSGVPLTTKKADACRIIHDRTVDNLAALGDADANLPGFVNNANVPLVSPVNGGWATATADEILEDMFTLEWAPWLTSKELFPPDTMLMSSAEYKRVNTKMYVANGVPTGKTVLKTFLENSTFVKRVEPWEKLDLADAEGNGPRLMVYKNDPVVVEIVLPRKFTQEPPQARNLTWIINCHSSIGGVQVNYPLGVAYMDGVND
jgi:hypothetical protein